MRASNARIAGVFSGILFAVCGGFAAGVAESANAQEVQARVYKVPTTAIPFPTFLPRFDITEPLTVAVTAYGGRDQLDFWVFFEGGTPDGNRRNFVNTTLSAEGLPIAILREGVERPVEVGDYIGFGGPTGEPEVSFLIYDNGGGVLHLAEGNEDVTLKAAGDLAADEFFLDANYRAMTTLPICGDDAMGYTGPADCRTDMDCPNGVDTATNECLSLTDDICRAMVPERMINSDGDMCIPIPDPGDGGTGGGESVVVSKAERNFPVVGAIVMGVLMFGLSQGGEEGEFSYSPSFGYSVNESGYSANVGGRMDFRKDEWTLFYTGGQTNANGAFGDFRYASGGEYKTDFWQAAFSESVSGEIADYDLSLSADLQGGIWSLSPVYRMHSRFDDGETATKNTLNLEGVLEYERWTIRQSAGFGWRRAENFGDSAKFRLEAVREF